MNSTIPHTNDRTRKRPKTAPTNTDPDHQHPQQDRNRKDATTTTTTTTNPEPPQDPDETDPPPPPSYYYPRSIVTWNCNGTGRVLALIFFLVLIFSYSSSHVNVSLARSRIPHSSIGSHPMQYNRIKSNRIESKLNSMHIMESKSESIISTHRIDHTGEQESPRLARTDPRHPGTGSAVCARSTDKSRRYNKSLLGTRRTTTGDTHVLGRENQQRATSGDRRLSPRPPVTPESTIPTLPSLLVLSRYQICRDLDITPSAMLGGNDDEAEDDEDEI